MVDEDGGLVERWTAAVNEGIRTGHWTAISELLRDDAEMVFAGIPVGPFAGRDAILDAYRERVRILYGRFSGGEDRPYPAASEIRSRPPI